MTGKVKFLLSMGFLLGMFIGVFSGVYIATPSTTEKSFHTFLPCGERLVSSSRNDDVVTIKIRKMKKTEEPEDIGSFKAALTGSKDADYFHQFIESRCDK